MCLYLIFWILFLDNFQVIFVKQWLTCVCRHPVKMAAHVFPESIPFPAHARSRTWDPCVSGRLLLVFQILVRTTGLVLKSRMIHFSVCAPITFPDDYVRGGGTGVRTKFVTTEEYARIVQCHCRIMSFPILWKIHFASVKMAGWGDNVRSGWFFPVSYLPALMAAHASLILMAETNIAASVWKCRVWGWVRTVSSWTRVTFLRVPTILSVFRFPTTHLSVSALEEGRAAHHMTKDIQIVHTTLSYFHIQLKRRVSISQDLKKNLCSLKAVI